MVTIWIIVVVGVGVGCSCLSGFRVVDRMEDVGLWLLDSGFRAQLLRSRALQG